MRIIIPNSYIDVCNICMILGKRITICMSAGISIIMARPVLGMTTNTIIIKWIFKIIPPAVSMVTIEKLGKWVIIPIII